MAALSTHRIAALFRPKPAIRASKKIYAYANAVYEKTGGATPDLVKVYRTYLDSKKTK
jgi:hypothetical protein